MRFAPRKADQDGFYTPLKHDLRREQQNRDRFLDRECMEGFGKICVTQECGEECGNFIRNMERNKRLEIIEGNEEKK